MLPTNYFKHLSNPANPNCRPYRTTLRKPQKPCSAAAIPRLPPHKKQQQETPTKAGYTPAAGKGSLKASLGSSPMCRMRKNPKHQNPIRPSNQNLTTNVLLKARLTQRLSQIISGVLML